VYAYVECFTLSIEEHVCGVLALRQPLCTGGELTQSDDRQSRAGAVHAVSEAAHDAKGRGRVVSDRNAQKDQKLIF